MERTIQASFVFDAAHRIIGLEPIEEQAIHGHTFFVKVKIKSEKLDNNAIIIDRNYVSKIIDPLIKELDHSCIIYREDPLLEDLNNLAKKFGFEHKIIVIEINPTIEGLTEYLFKRIKPLLPIENKIEVILKASESLVSSYSE